MNHIPNQYFRSTEEMLEAFSFIQDEKLRKEVVITNTHKVIDLIEPDIEVVVYPEKPFSPLMEKENPRVTSANMVYEKAHRLYGDPLPEYVEERIAQEFYGDKITDLVRKEYEKEKSTKEFKLYLHETILKGYDHIVDLKANEIKERDNIENDDEAKEKAKLELSGIIGGGFDVIYLIAPKKCRIYSEQDKIKIDNELGKLGGKIANKTRIGKGYEPTRGKLPKYTIPPYIP